jgi:plastocyanin
MRFFDVKSSLCVLAAGALAVSACSGSGGKASSAGAPKAADSTVPIVTPATQVIADTIPDGAERLKFSVPIDIVPGQNNIGYTRTIPQPKVDGYILGMSTDLRFADGTVPPVDVIHLHHGVWVNLAAQDLTVPSLPERFFAAGEEKTRMLANTGYGYKFDASKDKWLLNYMLHNQLSKPDKVWVTYDLAFVPMTSPLAKTIKPAKPVWMDVQNGSIYPVFDVLQGSGKNGTYTYPDDAGDPYACKEAQPGERRRRQRSCGTPLNQWTVKGDGVLLLAGGHMHPGGLRDDLWVKRQGATGLSGHTKPGAPDTAHVFSSVSTYWEPAGPASWDVAMSVTPDNWRVALKKGDVLSMNTTYETKTASWYESMGIMVLWMAFNSDGASGGVDPFTTPVDVQGVLTHGHLAENNNHGGAPDPKHYKDVTKLPSREVASGTVLPIADFAYEGDMAFATAIPTIKAGGSLTYSNADAGKGIPHTLTSCKAPCNLSTGIAYPLADGVPRFDSGELAQIGPPSNGQLTWSTPKNLPPGTYTYYCRIHPFMRGAFRVEA